MSNEQRIANQKISKQRTVQQKTLGIIGGMSWESTQSYY